MNFKERKMQAKEYKMQFEPRYQDLIPIAHLLGMTFTDVSRDDSSVVLLLPDGRAVTIYHMQDCCESVYLEDVDGPLDVLVGAPVTLAEQVSNHEEPPTGSDPESWTWTFVKLGTSKGSVTFRFYGTSNGFYSESVDVALVPADRVKEC